VFAAVTQLPALLAVAWLVPGIGTLLAGRLLALPMLIIFVPLALALCYFAMRQAPVRWREPSLAQGVPGTADGAVRRRAEVPAVAVIATLAIAAGFAAAFMPGLPLVLAGGTWLAGLPGALLMAPVIGGCAVLSFAGLVGRLVGARWAPAGALVLAVLLPEQYVSRAPFAEPLVQVLLFGGLCLLADSLAYGPGFGARGRGAVPAMILAGLAGVTLGLTALVSIGSLSILLPAFPVLALMFVLRRPQAGPFGIGLFAGVACGLYAGLALARPYLSSISSQLHLFGLCAGAFGLVTALVAPLAFPGVRRWVRRVFVARPRRWLPSLGSVVKWTALAVPVLVVAGFAARPYVQVTRGQTDPAVISYVADLQRLAHLPVDGRRQYYESSLDWVLWYLGIPAVLLAVAGAAALGWRWARVAAGGFDDGAAVGAAAPDHRLVRGDGAVGPGRAARPALGEPPAGARRAAGADPAWALGLIPACGTGGQAWRVAAERGGGRVLLRAGDGHPRRRDVAESGASRQPFCRARLVWPGQACEQTAVFRDRHLGDVRRVAGGGVGAVCRDRSGRERGLRGRRHRELAQPGRTGRVRAARRVRRGCLRAGRLAGGWLDLAGRPPSGAARRVAVAAGCVRGGVGSHAAAGAVAAHGRGRRGADRTAGRHVAGFLLGLDGRARRDRLGRWPLAASWLAPKRRPRAVRGRFALAAGSS
jgi:hypothetical protein